MLIRNGEHPVDPAQPPAAAPAAQTESGSLNTTGSRRSRGLVGLFDPLQGDPQAGLVRPAAIYTVDVDPADGARSSQTVQFLADHLRILVNSAYDKGSEAALAREVAAAPGPVLICSQSAEIPAIVQAFGTITPAPPTTWPEDRFDLVWTLTKTDSGWAFAEVTQQMLLGHQTKSAPG